VGWRGKTLFAARLSRKSYLKGPGISARSFQASPTITFVTVITWKTMAKRRRWRFAGMGRNREGY